jgi:hypothetical protein
MANDIIDTMRAILRDGSFCLLKKVWITKAMTSDEIR